MYMFQQAETPIQILSGSGFDSGSGAGSKTYGGVVFTSRSKTKSNTVSEHGKACCQGPLSIPNRATHIRKVVGWEKANQSWLFQSQIEPANPAKRANLSYFTVPCGISCDLSGLYPQRLMSRVSVRPGIQSSLAAALGGRRLDFYLMERPIPPDLSCKFFHQFQLLVSSKCPQNTASGSGHYSSILMLSLCVHYSRLRPTQPQSAKSQPALRAKLKVLKLLTPQVGPYRKCCHVQTRAHGHVL